MIYVFVCAQQEVKIENFRNFTGEIGVCKGRESAEGYI